jgi:hypothetical protein
MDLALKQIFSSSAYIYDQKYMAQKSTKLINEEIKRFLTETKDENLLRIRMTFDKPNIQITGGQSFGLRVKNNYRD